MIKICLYSPSGIRFSLERFRMFTHSLTLDLKSLDKPKDSPMPLHKHTLPQVRPAKPFSSLENPPFGGGKLIFNQRVKLATHF